MYVNTKDLPQVVRNELKKAGYFKASIKIQTAETVSPQYLANDGSRGYFCLIVNGIAKVTHGSWGGPNMFVNPAVDACEKELEIPDGAIVIKGSVGNQCFLTIYANGNTAVPMLPAPTEKLSPNEETVLRCHTQLKGGVHRREKYARSGLDPAVVSQAIKSLAEKGLLKVNRAGSSSVTTEGRNAHSRLERKYA